MKQNEIEVRQCSKCGEMLPLENFRLVKGQFNNPYYLRQCKKCEYDYQREYLAKKNEIRFSDNLEMLIDIQYKKVKPERILDLEKTGIIPLGTDEIFVKLMDYKEYYLSNYGRCIHFSNKQYSLLKGSHDLNGTLRYTVSKNVFMNDQWIYKREVLYAPQAVVEEFIVNPDIKNNMYIWHGGYDKEDNYYRNLYPLNREQYRVVKSHYMKTGDDSEDFIRNVINDIKYKPDDWSRRSMRPVICGIGYRGSENVDCRSEAYIKWHDMINRCYNEKFHNRQPQYKACTVCEEWLNFSNFKSWYEKNKYGNKVLDLDKDILFKGNPIYSPETVALVPHAINTLFLSGKQNRGKYPVGVYFDTDHEKFRACLSFMGEQIKLGVFDTPEEAFGSYKEYKEGLIRNMAKQYKGEIPDKVYQAMINWRIEMTD